MEKGNANGRKGRERTCKWVGGLGDKNAAGTGQLQVGTRGVQFSLLAAKFTQGKGPCSCLLLGSWGAQVGYMGSCDG